MSSPQPPEPLVRRPSDEERRAFSEGYALVLEGTCPVCQSPLERRTGCGWCGVCRTGWAASRAQGHEMFEDGELTLTRFHERADECRPLTEAG